MLFLGAIPAFGQVEFAFEPNRGQADPAVTFLTRGKHYGLYLTPNETVLRLQAPESAVVRMAFPGQKPNPRMEGLEERAGRSHYFGSGNRSVTNVPRYTKVRTYDVYPGIDVVYYGNRNQLEYDFIVEPGSDPSQIRMAFAGISGMALDAEGDLILKTAADPITQKKPRVYQEIDGGEVEVDSGYVISRGEVRFRLGEYDATKPLIIDPVLVYSTYFGGTGTGDQPYGIAVDAAGAVYVAGITTSADLAITGGVQQALRGQADAFVMKLNAAGNEVIYATYIGGSAIDEAHGIAIDSAGNAYITGFTLSSDFPVVGGQQTTRAGGQDGYLLKLNSSGNAILFSTYLGGAADDRGFAVALDASGNIYVTGATSSSNFPTANPLQRTSGGGFADIFVAKMTPAGSPVYSTYVGGFGNDQPLGIAIDRNGGAYVTGFTTSQNFPTANAIQTVYGGILGTSNPDDAFVFKINPAGTALEYSTFLGGINSDTGVRVAVDDAGGAYVTGLTSSINFPTAKPYQLLPAGEADAFLARLSPDGKSLVFSTFFGGFQNESGTAIALDRAGNVYIAGFTTSFDLPTANEVQNFIGGDRDAYVAKFMADGSTLMFSTFLGGLGADAAVAMAVDEAENIYITGLTSSGNFPTTNPVQEALATGQDLFVSKINAKDIVAFSQFQVASEGVSSVVTRGTRTDAVFGYASAQPERSATRLTGLAIVSSKQAGSIVTEVGVPAPELTYIGRLFVDFTLSARSVLSLANPNDEEASVDIVFTDETGASNYVTTVKIAPHQHFSRFVTDDPLRVDRPGTLNFSSSVPLAPTAFRTLSNEAGDFLLSGTPIADPTKVTDQPITIPQLAEGAGWITDVILVNTSENPMNGEVQFFTQGSGTQPGVQFEVGLGDGTTVASAVEYDIPARSFRRVNTANTATRSQVEFSGHTGFAFRTPGAAASQVTGGAVAERSGSTARLNGLELLEYRQFGVVQSQLALIAPVQSSSGRLFVEITDRIRTMISFVNPANDDAAVEFTLTDDAGTTSEPITVTIPAAGQYTTFLSEAPLNVPIGSTRTLKYTSSVPLFASAMRFFTNERSDSIVSALPVVTSSEPGSQPVVIPHFTNGGGWTTEIVLMNPSDAEIAGEVRFIGQNAAGVPVGTGIGTGIVFEYSIPPGSHKRFATNALPDEEAGIPDALTVGAVHVVPFGTSAAPDAYALIGQRVGDNTIFQAALAGQRPATRLRMYAEAFGDFEGGKPKSTRTAVALANASISPVTVRFEVTSVDGRVLGTSDVLEIPPHGQRALFLNQIPGFAGLPAPFQGILTVNVVSGSGIVATALRTMINERKDFLATAVGPLNEEPGLPGRLFFPYMADGTGYTTQFVLLNPPGVTGLAGVLRFVAPDATELAVEVLRLGSVRIVPFVGYETPHAHAILSKKEAGVTLFETAVEGQLPSPSYRFYAESIGEFDAGAAGSTRSAIALANPASSPATVRLELTRLDGRLVAASRPIQIPAIGEIAMFVHQIPGLEAVPLPFQGTLRVVTTSGVGVTATGMRAVYNERGDVLFTTTGPLVENAGAEGQVIFPHIAEGGGYTTQFIVVGEPSGLTNSGVLRFFNQEGNPLSVTLTAR